MQKETLNTPIQTLWDAGSAPGNHEETQEVLQQFYGDGTVLRHSLLDKSWRRNILLSICLFCLKVKKLIAQQETMTSC